MADRLSSRSPAQDDVHVENGVLEFDPSTDGSGAEHVTRTATVAGATSITINLDWDDAGVEIKQLLSPPARIHEFDGVFVPMEATMKNLLLDSQTKLIVRNFEPNPDFAVDTWDLRRLEGH